MKKFLSHTLSFTLFASTLLLATPALSKTYLLPRAGNDMIGQTTIIRAKSGDTLISLARNYDMSLHEMFEANQHVRPRRIRTNAKIIIPGQFILPPYRTGIVINLAELRLYYFLPDGAHVNTYPIGVGRRNWRTPTSKTRVIKKTTYPDWNVPKSIKKYTLMKTGRLLPDVIPGGVPDNPLGDYALYLAQRGILIHGTNKPSSVGRYISSGCIRLYPRDIEELYHIVPKGTRVHIINHSQKAGWLNGQLYLESHVPLRLYSSPTTHLNHDSATQAIEGSIKQRKATIDWAKVRKVAHRRTGIPTLIGHAPDEIPSSNPLHDQHSTRDPNDTFHQHMRTLKNTFHQHIKNIKNTFHQHTRMSFHTSS